LRTSAFTAAHVLILPAIALTVVLAPSLAAAQLAASKTDLPAPEEIADPLRALLGPAARVTAGGATLEFWWVSTLPVNGGPEWSQVAEGTFAGAVRVTGAFKEIRGKTVKPGVYTLRLGLQPQNGDHLGASQFREFLLLSPAAADTAVQPLGFEGTVALSKQTLGASHPAALSIDPPTSSGAPFSEVTNDLDHKGIVFSLKTSTGATLTFGLTLLGTVEH
jgi:hypothetical protein